MTDAKTFIPMDMTGPSPRTWLVATGNRHKVQEFRLGFSAVPGLILVGVYERGFVLDVAEDGETFAANALKKAQAYCALARMWTLADDSGLEVAALDGAPGVYSARYAGRHGDDAANNRRLLERLRGAADRRACFRCVLALCGPDGSVGTVTGSCPGTMLEAPRGAGGFGYDPLFVPDGASRTFAEMEPEEKARFSHRGRAMRAALSAWADRMRDSG